MVRKVITILLALIFTVQLCPPAWCNPPLETSAVSAVLMDAYSGQILYQKAPHQRVAPASVTKIMTMLVALEAIARGQVKWDDRVVASEAAWELGGSQIWLEPGEVFSLREMMIAIAVGSANDACVAVAEHIAGSEQSFVNLMNHKARELGLKNTHFVNAYGLPAKGHYTSAYDMAVICREALKYPEMLQLSSIKHYYKLRNGRPRLDNTNKLLWWYPGTDGFKTGWTTEANYCLASTVKRDGLRLICCVFGIPEPGGHFKESMKIYNWGFASYGFKKLFDAGQVLGRVVVGKGEQDQVTAVSPREVGFLMRKGEEQSYKTVISLLPYKEAPLARGTRLGEVRVLVNGRTVEVVPLEAGQAVKRGSYWRLLRKSLRSLAG